MSRRSLWVMGIVLAVGVTTCAAEVGGRMRLEGDALRATGWVALSQEWAGVDFSGRADADLWAVELRNASGTARVDWDWVVARTTLSHSVGGRTQVVSQLEAVTSAFLDPVNLTVSGGWQGRAAWTSGGRSRALGAWGSSRMEALPWWGEGRLDLGWPWTGVRWSLAGGWESGTWLQVRLEGADLSLQSAGLELGGESGRWSTSAYLAVLPSPSQGMTVRWGEDKLRFHTRLGLRSGGRWNAQIGASGRVDPLRWTASLDVGPDGWQGTTVEVRFLF